MEAWRRATDSPILIYTSWKAQKQNTYTIEAGMLLKTKTTTECAIEGGLSCPKIHRWGGHQGAKSRDEPVVGQLGGFTPPFGEVNSALQHQTVPLPASREVCRNPWLRLREDRVERSHGVQGIYGVVDKHDCAVILPIQGEN
ncbi:MAG: hypothetical protein ACLQVL_17275 [Terriglobia bacterium]